MITSITIDGLRGIRHGEVAGLGGLSILVGPNGCGKSTVLDALLIGAAPEPAEAVCRVIRRRAELLSGERPILKPQWLLYGGLKRGAFSINVGGLAKTNVLSEPPYLFVRPVGGEGGESRISASQERCQIIDAGRRRSWPDVALIDPLEDAVVPLHLAYSDAARVGRVAFANEVLRTLIPRFERLEILTEGANPVLYMHLGDAPIPVALAGEGVLALVRTVLELAACAEGGLALLEEPEVHQHPKSLRLMAQGICAAVKRGVRVVLTTHSLELVESLLHFASEAALLDQTSVQLVRLRDGELTSTCVEGEVARFQIQDIGEDLR